jgi:hypothetical protein
MKRPRRAKPEITPSTTRSLRQTAASLSDATTNLSEDSGQKDREGRPGIVFCSGPCSSMASRKPDTRSAVTLRASTPPTKTMPRAPDAISCAVPSRRPATSSSAANPPSRGQDPQDPDRPCLHRPDPTHRSDLARPTPVHHLAGPLGPGSGDPAAHRGTTTGPEDERRCRPSGREAARRDRRSAHAHPRCEVRCPRTLLHLELADRRGSRCHRPATAPIATGTASCRRLRFRLNLPSPGEHRAYFGRERIEI